MKKVLILIAMFFFTAIFIQAKESADGSEKQDAVQSGIDGEEGDSIQKPDKLPEKPNQQLTPNKNQFGKQMNDAERQKAMQKLLKNMGGGQQQGGGAGNFGDFVKMLQQAAKKTGGERSIKGKGKNAKKKAKKSGRQEKQHAVAGEGGQQIENLGDSSVSVEEIGAVGGEKMQHKGNGMKINKKKKNKPYAGQTLQNMGGTSPKKKRTKKD